MARSHNLALALTAEPDASERPSLKYRTAKKGCEEAPCLVPGEPILCRKLRRGAVMTAMPMRVVADAPDRIVLYQAADTAFRGASSA